MLFALGNRIDTALDVPAQLQRHSTRLFERYEVYGPQSDIASPALDGGAEHPVALARSREEEGESASVAVTAWFLEISNLQRGEPAHDHPVLPLTTILTH